MLCYSLQNDHKSNTNQCTFHLKHNHILANVARASLPHIFKLQVNFVVVVCSILLIMFSLAFLPLLGRRLQIARTVLKSTCKYKMPSFYQPRFFKLCQLIQFVKRFTLSGHDNTRHHSFLWKKKHIFNWHHY